MDNIRRDMIKYLEESLDKIELYKLMEHSDQEITGRTKKEDIYLEIQKNMLEELKKGYKVMGKINVEYSELGLEEDMEDFEEYEESIMGSGV